MYIYTYTHTHFFHVHICGGSPFRGLLTPRNWHRNSPLYPLIYQIYQRGFKNPGLILLWFPRPYFESCREQTWGVLLRYRTIPHISAGWASTYVSAGATGWLKMSRRAGCSCCRVVSRCLVAGDPAAATSKNDWNLPKDSAKLFVRSGICGIELGLQLQGRDPPPVANDFYLIDYSYSCHES